MTHWCPATGSDPSAPDAWRTGSALAALSHDLRTPLNAMLGFSQLLADCLIPAEDLSAVVTDILTSGEELLMQVIDVLNLACLEEMSPPFALAGVDIREIVLSALGRITPVLMKRQQGMDYIHADNLPPVPADAGWLGMALDRLLMEVAQSAKSDSTLTIRTCVADEHVGIVLQSIRETPYCVIPPNETQVIASGPLSGDTAGELRLGLIMAHRVVSMMGGTITRNQIPRGDCGWTIWLPVAPRETA